MFKEIYKDLISYLYEKNGGDVLVATRRALNIVPPMYNYVEGLGETDRISFLKRIYEVKQNKEFNDLLCFMSEVQKNFISERARNMEEVSVGRGTLNGFSLIKESLDEMSARYLSEIHNDKFDKFNVT